MASTDSKIASSNHQRWLKLTSGITDNIQEKWWKILGDRYSEAGRKYHTFLHLYRMFDHFDTVADEIQDKEAMIYAIFFHDVVYDAQSQENEEESIKLFKDFADESQLSQKVDLVTKVEELIAASKAHCTDEHKTEGAYGKQDVHYFLDFDLSILGSDPTDYKEYAAEIHEEYNFLPPQKYNFLRSKVLQLFLQVPNIYATRIFRDKYEEQARSNIQSEIDWLKEEL